MENSVEEIKSPTIYIPKKNVIMDSQMLSTLMSCARLFNFKFNMHLVSVNGKGESLEMGLIVHKFLETYYKSLIGGLTKSQAAGFAFIAAQEYSNSPEIINTPTDQRSWAIETCQQYLDYYKNDFWVPLEVEVVKGKVLYEDDEIRILWKAKLDWLADTNQGIYSVDHKSMKQRRRVIELNNQFIGQCILTGMRGVFVNKVGFQKTLEPKERFERVLIPYSADILMEWQSEILPYMAKFLIMYQETNHYPPTGWGIHCDSKYGLCSFYDVCKANRNMREETLGQQFVVGEQWDITNE